MKTTYEIVTLRHGVWTSDLGDDYRTYASREEAEHDRQLLLKIWRDEGQWIQDTELIVREVQETE